MTQTGILLFFLMGFFPIGVLAQTVIDAKGTKFDIDISKWKSINNDIYNKNSGSVGIGTAGMPNSNAALEVSANNKGILIPRVALTSTSAFAPLSTHTAGMIVYNTATTGTVPTNVYPGFYYNDGSKWIRVADVAQTDPSKDAWIDDNSPGSKHVTLGTLSDGSTSRPAGTAVVIKDDGKVGIGGDNPTQKLSVVNGNISLDNTLPDVILNSTNNTKYSRILFQENGTSLGVFQMLGTNFANTTRAGNLEFFSTVNGNDITFLTSGVNERLRIRKTGNIGIGTNNPQANLDIRETNPASPSANAGIAVPQVNTLPSTGNRAGQVVYFTLQNRYYFYDGSKWECLNCAISFGDIKQSFSTADHNGWVLLDGRAISSLTATQQAQALSMGLTTILPNANDRILKKKGNIGATGGANSITLAQVNLPNVNFSGTALSTGSEHMHGFADRGSGEYLNRTANTGGTLDLARSRELSNQTTLSGDHSHTVTVNSGGSGAAILVENPYLSVNSFIYLGL